MGWGNDPQKEATIRDKNAVAHRIARDVRPVDEGAWANLQTLLGKADHIVHRGATLNRDDALDMYEAIANFGATFIQKTQVESAEEAVMTTHRYLDRLNVPKELPSGQPLRLVGRIIALVEGREAQAQQAQPTTERSDT